MSNLYAISSEELDKMKEEYDNLGDLGRGYITALSDLLLHSKEITEEGLIRVILDIAKRGNIPLEERAQAILKYLGGKK